MKTKLFATLTARALILALTLSLTACTSPAPSNSPSPMEAGSAPMTVGQLADYFIHGRAGPVRCARPQHPAGQPGALQLPKVLRHLRHPARRRDVRASRGPHCNLVILPSVYKGQHGFLWPNEPLTAFSSLPGVSPAASSALPATHFTRRKKLLRTPGTWKPCDGKAAARGFADARQGRERRQRAVSMRLGRVALCTLRVTSAGRARHVLGGRPLVLVVN